MRDGGSAGPAPERNDTPIRGADDVDAIQAALQKLLASPPFAHSHQLQRLLEFTVARTLSGRSDEIKEYTIAVEVFGRGASHDSKIDPIVRTEARRLRRKLEEYYHSEGTKESVRIDYPKGGYVPTFSLSSGAGPAPSRLLRLNVVTVLAGLSLLLVGVVVWKSRGTPSGPTPEAGTNEAGRIAVLPFDDFSPGVPDPSLAYAITESLITRLAKIEGLSVASRTSVTQVKDRNLELREIASLLQTDYLVEGSIIRSGNDCRVSVQLIRTRDDRHLWAEEYEIPWSDVLQVTSGTAESVARALSVTLSNNAEHEPSAFSHDPEAVESFARGQYYLLQFQLRRLRPHAGEAERYLKKALERDPEYVDAMVALAELSSAHLYPPQGVRAELLGRTEQYLEQALSKNPNHAAALSLLGSVAAERGDRDKALRMSRRALELAPQDARTHAEMGARLASRGFYEAALLQYEEALKLDPLHAVAHGARNWVLGKLGRFDEALKAHEVVRQLEPEGPTVDLVLGDIHLMAGNLAEARRVWNRGVESALQDADISYLEIALGLVDALGGHENAARRVAEKYRDSYPRTMDHLIQLFALVGEYELALNHIRKSSYYANYRWLATTASLQKLRRAPGFRNLLEEFYSHWQQDIVDVGREFSSAPELPPPEELLRQDSASDRPLPSTREAYVQLVPRGGAGLANRPAREVPNAQLTRSKMDRASTK